MPENPLTPRVTTIILNWNGIGDTLECIESVRNLDYPDIRIVVVDNGSTDDSTTVIRQKYPSITLLESKRNLGFTGGNNLGIVKALEMGTDYVWLLNNDTVVERDALRNMVQSVGNSPDVGIASPVIYFHDPPKQVQFCGSYIDWVRKRIVKLEIGDPCPSNGLNVSLWGTALLIRRDVVEKVGFLNDKYFAYHEDEEYSMRVARAGYRAIVVPEASVFHKNSRSTGSNDAPLQVFLRSRNIYFLWMDNLKGIDKLKHVPKYLAHIIAYCGLLREKQLTEAISASLDGMWHAFHGIGGPRNAEIKMPNSLKHVLNFVISWHPYFWSSLLMGNISDIYSGIKNEIKMKFYF